MKQSFKIREATIGDVPALAALHVKTYRETHGFWGSPNTKTRLFQWQKFFHEKDVGSFCIVIDDEEENLIGFAKGEPYIHGDHAEFSGELNKIYVLKKYHRLGLGRQLLCKVANEFIQRGINSMLLFGDAKNPSNGFYEKMGAGKLFAKNGDFHGGYGWSHLSELATKCTPDQL